MNCKPGDLAIVRRCPHEAYNGRVCKVLSHYMHEGRSAWSVDPAPEDGYGYFDEWLHPIRDKEGEDETLQWAPVPVKEIA